MVWNLPFYASCSHFSPTPVFCVSEGKCFLLPFPLFLSYTRLCVQFPPTSGCIYVLQKISFLLRSCDSTSDLPRDKDLTCFPSSQRTGYVWSCRAVEAATDFTYSRAFQNSTGHSIESQCPLRSPVVSVLNSYICRHFWICPPWAELSFPFLSLCSAFWEFSSVHSFVQSLEKKRKKHRESLLLANNHRMSVNHCLLTLRVSPRLFG